MKRLLDPITINNIPNKETSEYPALYVSYARGITDIDNARAPINPKISVI